MKSTPHYDFTITRKQSQILLTPRTQRAEVWCKVHLSKIPKLGDAFVIAPDDFGKVAMEILEAGFTVQREG
jgi:hypothetical protein